MIIGLNNTNRYSLIYIVFFIIFYSSFIQAQHQSINVDSLYYQANDLYKNKSDIKAFDIVNTALNIAPDYIDIRVLRIRLSQRLHKFKIATNDIKHLLINEDSHKYKNLVFTQLNLIDSIDLLNDFIRNVGVFYKEDIDFNLFKATAYLRLKDIRKTRKIMSKLKKNKLNVKQQYQFHLLSKQINTNQIGIYYNISSFLKEYPTKKSWHTTQLEYMKFTGGHSFGARVTYGKRFIDSAILYELESYPVFSNKFYSYINVSTSSKSDFFQKFGLKTSIYYAVFKWIEIETGFRYLSFNKANFTTYIAGATSYYNKFYLNARIFIGPKIEDDFIQNYQINVRYYYSGAKDYLSIRLGTGISPDESSRFMPVTTNLNSYYLTIGGEKSLKGNYNLLTSIGYLSEELRTDRIGNQLFGGIGLKYRF